MNSSSAESSASNGWSQTWLTKTVAGAVAGTLSPHSVSVTEVLSSVSMYAERVRAHAWDMISRCTSPVVMTGARSAASRASRVGADTMSNSAHVRNNSSSESSRTQSAARPRWHETTVSVAASRSPRPETHGSIAYHEMPSGGAASSIFRRRPRQKRDRVFTLLFAFHRHAVSFAFPQKLLVDAAPRGAPPQPRRPMNPYTVRKLRSRRIFLAIWGSYTCHT